MQTCARSMLADTKAIRLGVLKGYGFGDLGLANVKVLQQTVTAAFLNPLPTPCNGTFTVNGYLDSRATSSWSSTTTKRNTTRLHLLMCLVAKLQGHASSAIISEMVPASITK